jgi:hypothetical protein
MRRHHLMLANECNPIAYMKECRVQSRLPRRSCAGLGLVHICYRERAFLPECIDCRARKHAFVTVDHHNPQIHASGYLLCSQAFQARLEHIRLMMCVDTDRNALGHFPVPKAHTPH